MSMLKEFCELSPMVLADCLSRNQIMDAGIRPLWHEMPRVVGSAFPVLCSPGDNLMVHAAIYRAPPGSVIVIQGCDSDFAVAGGNVCAVAQKNGIEGFVVDGVIRDLAEIRSIKFPVFSRGVIPIPGGKEIVHDLNKPVMCGGVRVSLGDIIVADEEGIVVIPLHESTEILKKAKAKAAKDSTETLAAWEVNHRARIEEILRKKGFTS